MTPSLDHRGAARILDIAESRGSRSAALVGFAVILLLAAHAAARGGFPSSAQAAAMYFAGAYPALAAQAGESPEMKRLMAIGVAAAAMTAGAGAQDAVQWRVEDGGNGHWYAFKAESTVICWHDARALCELQGGHLASITSPAENQLLLSLTIPNNPGVVQGGPYIGGTCEGLPWGQWYWITGEPFSYTAWMSGAPNGSSGTTEQYLHFWRWSNLGWNDQIDCGGLMFSYLIEWSADCNSDGIVDYGQILDGSLTDTNTNNIPDCCEAGVSCPIAAKQWRVEDGGNGHWYGLKRMQPSVSPESFFTLADQIGGHAATITSSAENGFCGQFVVPYDGTLFGLRKPAGTNQVSWVTGESVTYVNWNTGEGTNLGERYALLLANNAKWQDTDLTPRQWLLVEFDADCNSDGIVDFGQIRAGELADANANNIPDCCEVGTTCDCPGDTNRDGAIDGIDLATVLTRWGQSEAKFPESDCNREVVIDGSDLAIVLGSWGACP